MTAGRVSSATLGSGPMASYEDRRLFLVPADRTVLVKNVLIRNQHTAGCEFRIKLEKPPAPWFYIFVQALAVGTNHEWEPWMVLGPGWAMRIQNQTAGPINILVSGAVLYGVAETLVATKPA